MEHTSINQLSEQFKANQANQFTGKLLVYSKTGQQWAIYFLLGRLIWASGGNHRFRRLFRLLSVHAAHLNLNQLPVPDTAASRLWEYSVLCGFIRQNRISSGPATQLIQAAILEVLGEVLQEATGFEQSAHTVHRIKKLGNPVVVLRPDQCFATAQQRWTQWRHAGLISYSPNLAPTLKYPEKLKPQVPLVTYQKLSTLLTGEKTLRDLAAHLKTDLLAISQALLPFVNQGIIALNPIPDWTPPEHLGKRKIGNSTGSKRKAAKAQVLRAKSDKRPLILGVDDSPAICKMLKKVMNRGGYRFIGVHESFRTLPTMFKRKPDLIFLDLMMPVSNGYEVCSQIRRIAAFRSIPIVILSGNDGMVDRVRAKLVGATDFVSKPFDDQQLLAITQKYLHTSTEGQGDRPSSSSTPPEPPASPDPPAPPGPPMPPPPYRSISQQPMAP